MKRYKKFLTIAAAVLFAASGCVDEAPYYDPGKETPDDKQTGFIDVSSIRMQVLIDSDLSSEGGHLAVRSTRAQDPQPAGEEYIVQILDSEGSVVLNTNYGSLGDAFTDNLLELPTGAYTLKVSSHETILPCADTPAYGTVYPFEITRAHTAENPLRLADQIVCKLTSIKVTVDISADLSALLSEDTRSTVSIGDAKADLAKGETRAVYFRPQNPEGDNLLFQLTGEKQSEEGAGDWQPVTQNKTIPDVKAGQWRNIKLQVQYSTTGAIVIAVTVDNFVQDDRIDINSTETLWEPILTEDSDLPELTWPGHDLARPVSIGDAQYDASGNFTGTAPVLSLSAPEGIASVKASMSSDNASFTDQIQAAGLNGVDLCTVNNFSPLRPLRITAGATEATLDMGGIMYLFFGYPGTHTFSFEITDNRGNTATASILFAYGGGVPQGPSIVWRQGNIDAPAHVTNGMEIDIDINSAKGIENFVVTIISETLNAEVLESVGLQESFDLANIEEGSELAGALTDEIIGFPINADVKGKTYLQFTITKFLGMLSAFPGEHSFRLAVTDRDGTTVKTLKLIVE